MERYFINVPKAKYEKKTDPIEVFINLVGTGLENAVKREDLVLRCEVAGLIGSEVKDKDRAMRKLLQRARMEYVILSDYKGAGYYRPTHKERVLLSKSNKRESSRAINVFSSTKLAKALEEDYKYDRC